tara:strand:- start:640 stop:1269 length:630 start_codon:yes stop_codon:yes gene_type:complete
MDIELFNNFLKCLILYFVVIDPLGTSVIFLSVFPNIKDNKYKVAIEATFYAFIILVFFLILGEIMLSYLNIYIYAFKISGGILLLLISIEMLFDKRSKRRKRIFSNDEISTAIFPLAIPLLAGPASITSVILTSQSNTKNINILITNISALFFVLLITLVILLLTVRTERFINKKVLQVFSRLIAIILSALSIQLIIDGITEFIKLNFD